MEWCYSLSEIFWSVLSLLLWWVRKSLSPSFLNYGEERIKGLLLTCYSWVAGIFGKRWSIIIRGPISSIISHLLKLIFYIIYSYYCDWLTLILLKCSLILFLLHDLKLILFILNIRLKITKNKYLIFFNHHRERLIYGGNIRIPVFNQTIWIRLNIDFSTTLARVVDRIEQCRENEIEMNVEFKDMDVILETLLYAATLWVYFVFFSLFYALASLLLSYFVQK